MANFMQIGDICVNLDHVREVRSHWDKKKPNLFQTAVFFANSEDVYRCEYPVDYAERVAAQTAVVVSANPGFEYIEYMFSDEAPTKEAVLKGLTRTPILAWRVDHNSPDFGPEPIGVDSFARQDDIIGAILCPNGWVFKQFDSWHRDLDCWVSEVIEKWEAHAWKKLKVVK